MATPVSIAQSPEGIYLLSGELDRDTVPTFWSTRSNWLPKGDNIVISLAELTRIDSAGMAMLIQLQHAFTSQQRQITFIHVPSQLSTLLQLSNATHLLNL